MQVSVAEGKLFYDLYAALLSFVKGLIPYIPADRGEARKESSGE